MVAGAWRIHFTYRTVEKPWGGANNFLRALGAHLLERGDFVFTDRLDDPCDILFMNQLGQGPGADGRKLTLRSVRGALASDNRKLVARAVNLNRHAFRLGPRNLIRGSLEDRGTLRLLEMADLAVFQSQYQRDVFRAAGYRGRSDVVIHNGADRAFWNEAPPTPPPGQGPLRLVSATASPRRTKRHDLIAAIADLPGVEVVHCGAWPEGVNSGRVKRQGVIDRYAMAALYREAHFLLHPAEKDPCPNSIFEALCAGLPVIYGPGPGSSAEIVGGNGLPINLADLAGSIAGARATLSDLQDRVRETRHHYRIERAAQDYAAAFDGVLDSRRGM